MLFLVVPTFRIIESDLLLRCRVKWRFFNWSLVPFHRTMPSPLRCIYALFGCKVCGKQPLLPLLKILSGSLASLVAAATFKVVQVMIVIQSGYLVEMFQLGKTANVSAICVPFACHLRALCAAETNYFCVCALHTCAT